MSLPTPPLTPETFPAPPRKRPIGSPLATAVSPDSPPFGAFALPPPLLPALDLDPEKPVAADNGTAPWRADMSAAERDAREAWLAGGRGRRGLRIVIVTENFLPKVDGVTRTLARLLEHLEREGHQCMLLGPGTGMSHYASHPLVGTAGVPLVVYPGLKLNFLRPMFLRTIQDFEPDVVHFVDPIWLGAQTLVAMELGWAGAAWVAEGGPAIGTGISGAVVASYHTNLATYATLFGMGWLEPIMWRLQRWLYSKTLLTLCPSPSTKSMLESQAFADVRLWPRGVDLSQFGPSKRCAAMRASWGVSEYAPGCQAATAAKKLPSSGIHHSGRKSSLPLTPPASPITSAQDAPAAAGLPSRIVLLYVGRISWEKNLVLLLRAYGRLPAPRPKLVFVGDGPARTELQSICAEEAFDASFMGHRSGAELAAAYASADVFAFPSFTETFGQVVLEALASGLPVVGLDAEGTRDLVAHERTGLLLPLPGSNAAWPAVCRPTHPLFASAVEGYAALLARAASEHAPRRAMGAAASTDGIRGFTWWDAMERCVDGYREALGRSLAARRAREQEAERASKSKYRSSPRSPSPVRRISRVNRALSSRLANPATRVREAETLWHLKTVAKAFLVAFVFCWIWARHLAAAGREMGWDEVWFRPAK